MSDVKKWSGGGHVCGTGVLIQPVRLVLQQHLWKCGTEVNNDCMDCMIWRDDKLFSVPFVCNVNVLVACLLRYGCVR